MANEEDGNKKPFYNYVKRKTKSRAGIGPITKDNGELATEDREVAEELNRYFSSVFTREDTTNVPAPPPMVTRTRLTRSFITTEKVRRKIRFSSFQIELDFETNVLRVGTFRFYKLEIPTYKINNSHFQRRH